MKKTSLAIIGGILAAALQAVPAADISGTVTLKGAAPKETEIPQVKDDPNCSKLHASDSVTTHHYVVGAKGELANVVLVLKVPGGKSTGATAAPAVLDQKGCEYVPSILAVQTDQKILIKNSDPVTHNVHTLPAIAGNKEINQAQAEKAPDLSFSASKPENFLKFKCDVHPWMFAWVSVIDHPYFAVSDKDGKYTIKDVPDGKYELQAFHRKAAPASAPATQQVEVKGGNVTADFSLEPK
jgi:plastocyanin